MSLADLARQALAQLEGAGEALFVPEANLFVDDAGCVSEDGEYWALPSPEEERSLREALARILIDLPMPSRWNH